MGVKRRSRQKQSPRAGYEKKIYPLIIKREEETWTRVY